MFKKLSALLAVCILVGLLTAASATAQQKPSIDITLEPQSDGIMHVTATGTFQEEASSPMSTQGLSEGSLNISVDSPSSGSLSAELEGNLSFSEVTDQIDMSLGMLDKDSINNGVPGMDFPGLNSFEGENLTDLMKQTTTPIPTGETDVPPELSDLKIEELNCTNYEWNSSEGQLDISLTGNFSGSVFENEELREELPLTANLSMSISETALSMQISMESTSNEIDLDINSSVDDSVRTTTLELEAYLELPHTDNMVKWNMGLPKAQGLLENYPVELEERLSDANVTVTLDLPSDADVSKLPAGAQQDGDTYTWTNENATSAFSTLMTSGEETEISYQYTGVSESETELPLTWIGLGIGIVIIIIIAGLVLRYK